ncbi:LOW QUALITY PROTEIN: hypothetical protein Cgig2_030207 [Carnegiea gigantea]|uniref:Uncharacterized protein n=1 Tax=Carnegiea gigantea TaxID=171969 RepID=A0A9Q1QEL2_9CARY|nr:LOW QUALITY PROTEIN: hypothetical protein Cgig2_030207 [Carnegiea gigantea]
MKDSRMVGTDDAMGMHGTLIKSCDTYGTLLEHCVKEKNKAQLVTNAWRGFFEVMHYAEVNEEDLNMVVEVCKSLKKKLTILGKKLASQKIWNHLWDAVFQKKLKFILQNHQLQKEARSGSNEERRKRWNRNRNILNIVHLVVNMHIMIGEIALQRIKIIYPNNW